MIMSIKKKTDKNFELRSKIAAKVLKEAKENNKLVKQVKVVIKKLK